MEIEDEIARVASALKEQLLSVVEMPAFKDVEWSKDFHVAMGVAVRMPATVEFDHPEEDEAKLVARAARMADLMQAERKKRRATAGTGTTQ